MQSRNNQGEVISEINTKFTDKGEKIVTNTLYSRGNPVFQHVSVRDNEGKVRTTNIIGWKNSSLAAIQRPGSHEKKRREQGMQIGEPLRTIIVEPLELPVKQPTGEPDPIHVPEPEPERVPVAP